MNFVKIIQKKLLILSIFKFNFKFFSLRFRNFKFPGTTRSYFTFYKYNCNSNYFVEAVIILFAYDHCG